MNLGHDTRSDRALLSDLSDRVKVRETALVKEWADVVTWANRNTVTTPEQAATIVDGVIDTGVPIAGDGAPLVSEFNLMELIAVLGRSPDGGRMYVGRIIETAWRLPNVYAAVAAGRFAPWRAERIADLTRPLNADAAAFVDRQLFDVTACTWAQIGRLVDEAILRFDPELAEAEREAAADHRHVECGEVDRNGQIQVHAQLDGADGHDFDLAVNRRAIQRGQLGDTRSLDVRRSVAVGDLARADLALDLIPSEVEEVAQQPSRDPATPKTIPGRKVVLNVHLSEATISGVSTGSTNGEVGRWEDKQVPISATQIKEWLGVPGTTVTVRPVINLADHVPVDSYEIPDRLRARVELRDHTCRFPNCPKQATQCDLDHARPHAEGGSTCPCNLVPLCRRHHRAKTHSQWRYQVIRPGTYLWTSPHDRRFLVDHHGTHALDDY